MPRIALLTLITLLLSAIAGCPAGDGGDADGRQGAVQDSQPDEPVRQGNPELTVSNFIRAMNNQDRETYVSLLHPDGPEYEELLAAFDEFGEANMSIDIDDISVNSRDGDKARVGYDMLISELDSDERPEYESGIFELHYIDGAWIIWDSD